MVRVKICGNTDLKQIEMCVLAGADAVGVVVNYPAEVPWNVTVEEARGLVSAVPPFVASVVVTGGEVDHVVSIARKLLPDALQLHTDNSVEDTRRIVEQLAPMRIPVLRALRINADDNTASGEIRDPLEAAVALQQTGIAGIVLDSRTTKMPAGTGVRVDWQLAARVRDRISIPLILAGGLDAATVAEATGLVRPHGVDVITGVEVAHGIKDPQKVAAFVQAAKNLSRLYSPPIH